jgi:hypothetical protein
VKFIRPFKKSPVYGFPVREERRGNVSFYDEVRLSGHFKEVRLNYLRELDEDMNNPI